MCPCQHVAPQMMAFKFWIIKKKIKMEWYAVYAETFCQGGRSKPDGSEVWDAIEISRRVMAAS